MDAIDRLLRTIRGVSKNNPVTHLQLSEIIRRLWSDQGKIIQIIYNEIINNTTNIYQSISQIIGSKQADNHHVVQIEDTVNVSETVVSPWSVLPYNQQMGEFKAVVAVRNKTTNTIITLISLLSFDYSDVVPALIQNNLLTDAALTLTVGVDGSNMLYATVSGMPGDAKRIHFCLERCVLSERESPMTAIGILELNESANLTKYILAQASISFKLNGIANLINLEKSLQASVLLGLNGLASISKAGLFSNGIWRLYANAKLAPVFTNINYGCLYPLATILDSRNIAAPGWHPETVSESNYLRDINGWHYSRQGANLKETGTDHWVAPNTVAYNLYGFNARGCGFRGNTIYSVFQSIKQHYAGWIVGSSDYNSYFLTANEGYYSVGNAAINNGQSIRLVKDSSTLYNGQHGVYIGNDGKIYETIKIGDIEILAHDLAETKFRTGEDIPEVTLQADWGADENESKLCAYDNDWTNVLTI